MSTPFFAKVVCKLRTFANSSKFRAAWWPRRAGNRSTSQSVAPVPGASGAILERSSAPCPPLIFEPVPSVLELLAELCLAHPTLIVRFARYKDREDLSIWFTDPDAAGQRLWMVSIPMHRGETDTVRRLMADTLDQVKAAFYPPLREGRLP